MEDAIAQIRAIALRRGRNAYWGEQAVRQGAAIPAEEAVRLRVVDLLARDTEDLLRRVDGREVQLPDGKRVLRTAHAAIVPVGRDLRERFLDGLAEPNLGLILAAIAMLGIIYELSSPGAILPGIIGGIALILALTSFAMLDVNYAGVALIGFAALLFVTDLFIPTYGILSAGGVISFILGALLLTSSNELLGVRRASPLVIFPLALSMGAFFFFVAGSALRAQRRKPFAGQETLVGEPGVARTDLKPRGMVLVQGELWSAEVVDGPVPTGERVRVVATEGLKLRVRREKHE
jgi:membrane-bound serine protease (ClpP class)